MTLCPFNGGHCQCQPDEGVECDQLPRLRKAVAAYERSAGAVANLTVPVPSDATEQQRFEATLTALSPRHVLTRHTMSTWAGGAATMPSYTDKHTDALWRGWRLARQAEPATAGPPSEVLFSTLTKMGFSLDEACNVTDHFKRDWLATKAASDQPAQAPAAPAEDDLWVRVEGNRLVPCDISDRGAVRGRRTNEPLAAPQAAQPPQEPDGWLFKGQWYQRREAAFAAYERQGGPACSFREPIPMCQAAQPVSHNASNGAQVSQEGQPVAPAARSDEDSYLIQDTRTFVGNCVLWWGPGGRGYTSNLNEAGRYTREQAMRQHASRPSDKPWRLADVLPHALPRVDWQDLREAGTQHGEHSDAA